MTDEHLRIDLFGTPERSPAGLQLTMRAVRHCSMGIWTVFAVLFAALWVTGDGSPAFGAWIAVCLAASQWLHAASSRSRHPERVLHWEMIFAGLVQGAMLPFVEFRFLPSLVLLTPVTGFVLLGGLRLYFFGLLALGSSCWIVTSLLGAGTATTSSGWVQLFCGVAILSNQVGIAVLSIWGREHLAGLRKGTTFRDEADEETGLRTREYLRHVLTAARETSTSGSVDLDSAIDLDQRLLFTVVHIDRLHTIRQQYGRPAAERLLREMAHRLAGRVQDPDLVVRWDQGEFLVLNHLDDASDAAPALDRIQRIVRGRPFDVDASHSLRVTTSLGSALMPQVPATATRLPWRHVVALAHYAASQALRIGNRWLLVREDLDEGSREFKTAQDLDELVAAGVLVLEEPPAATR